LLVIGIDPVLKHKGGKKRLMTVNWLPFSLTMQDNTHHPYGLNEGAMIPAAGGQVMMRVGFYTTIGKHISIQVQPELVGAQNTAFQAFNTEYAEYYWRFYYPFLNRIDMPEHFGVDAYKKVLPGQSSIRYRSGNLSIGLSTENMWWGPGTRNALVMTNNAHGFLHGTFNSIKPIQTRIGSFEWQLIGGRLTSSGFLPSDTNHYFNGVKLYEAKKEEDRYISGMVVSWQPKWVKGLYIGFANASYLYQSDISGIADLLPLQGLIVSKSEQQNKKASLGSVFLRYILPEEHAEFYAEYGRNDRSASIVNLITDKDYPKGYVIGLRKMTDKKANGSQIEFAAEITQLELPNGTLVNQLKSWYLNDYVRQGYTNNGQLLGAGIGPGGSSQTLDISWVRGMSKLGLRFERTVHNNDFYNYAFAVPPDVTRHWVDLGTSFHAEWKYKRFLFSSELGLIRSLNYEWWIIPGAGYYEHGYDFLNFHGRLGVWYRL
jgi:hypothetical protein